MKFLFGLFLTSALLYSVYMLQCLRCDSLFCEKPFLTECDRDESCATALSDATFLGFNFTLVERFCASNVECAHLNASVRTFTASVGVGRTSVTSTFFCCNTDGCNSANVDVPNKRPNGLKCKSCSSFHDENCDTDLDCVGSQNRCFNDTGAHYITSSLCDCASLLPFGYGFGNNTLKGCISSNICHPSVLSNVSCCEGSFCNKGVSWMSKVNFSLLSVITIVSLL